MPNEESQTQKEVVDLGMRHFRFKYPIGQPVQLKVAGKVKTQDYARGRPLENVIWVVNEQIVIICSGGVQRHYDCRGVVQGGSVVGTTHARFYEHELEPAEPFPNEQEVKDGDTKAD